MSSLNNIILYNHSLVSAFVAWCLAQIIKTCFLCKNKKCFKIEWLVSSGGMPSSHSAAVSALAVSISKECGVCSPIFSISMVLAAIVMYDSYGVRHSTGEQAKLLNKIVNALNSSEILSDEAKADLISGEIKNETKCTEDKFKMKVLKEKLGHTPFEVLGGAILGIIIALIFSLK